MKVQLSSTKVNVFNLTSSNNLLLNKRLKLRSRMWREKRSFSLVTKKSITRSSVVFNRFRRFHRKLRLFRCTSELISGATRSSNSLGQSGRMSAEDSRSHSSEKVTFNSSWFEEPKEDEAQLLKDNEELMQDLLECYNDITASQLQVKLEDLYENAAPIEKDKNDEKSESENLNNTLDDNELFAIAESQMHQKEEPASGCGSFASTQRRNSLSDDELFNAAVAQIEEEKETNKRSPVKSTAVHPSTSNPPQTMATSAIGPKSHVTATLPSNSVASSTARPAIQRPLTSYHEKALSPILRPSVIRPSTAPQPSFISTIHRRQNALKSAPSPIPRPAIAHPRPSVQQPPTSIVRPSVPIIIPPNTKSKISPPLIHRQYFDASRLCNPSSSVVIQQQINSSRQNAPQRSMFSQRPIVSQRPSVRPPLPVLISSRTSSARSAAPLIPVVRSPAAIPNKRSRDDEVDDFYDDAVSAMFFEDLLRDEQGITGKK
ncbi:hypothetical protein M3Y96_00316600 [Aphelenchoides besseyi]|nr:hypothetical protein M3Y96_00316600 [Aphelenchoides besseyi]